MTREEHISNLETIGCDGWVVTTDAYKSLQFAIQALEQGPSGSEKSNKWIPVSERLPEDRREVLVTVYWHETYQVMMGSYYGDGLWWCVPFNNCGEHMQRLKPKAWMPLPKIYNGGGKTGKWINGDCEGGNCSICGKYYAFYPESGDFNYCPNCGAKMQEVEE